MSRRWCAILIIVAIIALTMTRGIGERDARLSRHVSLGLALALITAFLLLEGPSVELPFDFPLPFDATNGNPASPLQVPLFLFPRRRA